MTRRLWPLVILAALVLEAPGEAQNGANGRFAFERTVTTGGAGPHQLPVDAALLGGGQPFRVVPHGNRLVAEDGLADLRLFGPGGATVPYLLIHPPAADTEWIPGAILAIPETKETSGFEADFGSAQPIDVISVEGIPAPFLKRLSVDGSGDRTRWTSLAPDATLFDLPSENLRQTQTEFTAGEYRYVRVTWDDTNSARVPLPQHVRARRAMPGGAVEGRSIDVPFERQPSEPGRSRYRVRLPGAQMPIVAIELEAGGGYVFRAAVVTESRFAGHEAAPVELGRATLSRVVRNGMEAAALRVPISPPAETDIQLVIDDGSNPPLEVTRVLARLAVLPAIYFEAPAREVVARYGDPALERPRYDLEAARLSIDLRNVPEARWAPPRALLEPAASSDRTDMPQPGGTIDPGGFRHVRAIADAAAGLVALQLDAAVLAHSRGPSRRFADVRVLDTSDRQLPYLVERRDEPLEIGLSVRPFEGSAAELKGAPGRVRSVYTVTLPYAKLPPASLVLETETRVFQRSVQLGIERPPDRRHRDTWFDVLASAAWRHSDRATPAPALSLSIPTVDATDLLLVVDEGDNAPLKVGGARLLLPSYRLRYYQPASDEPRLAYGRDDLQTPEYDLALLAQHVMGAPAQELMPGPEQQSLSPVAGDFITPITFWILIGVAVVMLLGIIVKLITSSSVP